MKKLILLLLVLPLMTQLPAQNLKGMLKKAKSAVTDGGGLSSEEAGAGLKEALDVGVGKAVDFLSAEDGYFKSPYKILIPEEAQKVTSKLKSVPGFGDVEANLEEKLNRAAEIAAAKAKPIFIQAIKNMTFKDALNLLMGKDDAATRYLEKNTYDNLFGEFLPVIQNSLDEVNARTYWKKAVTAHNKIPFVKKANPELDDYVTKKALIGMFSLIEKKEGDIRNNKSARTSELLTKVFAKQDQ